MEPRDPKESRQRGGDFESIFQKMCQFEGLLVRKVPLSCRPIGTGQFLPIDSELDWQVGRAGITAFLDTKSCKDERMAYSEFKESQVKIAAGFNLWRIPSGFVVWFRAVDRVIFFTGAQVEATQGASLGADDGLDLGTGFEFSVRKIFDLEFK